MQLNKCISIDDLRRLAHRRLPKPIFDFLEGGADDEWTMRQNIDRFDAYPLMPGTLVDIGEIDMSSNLLGCDIDWPVIAAPTGASALFHHTGEAAVAEAVANSNTFYAMSTMSTQSLEHIGGLNNAPKIFQVYVFRDRGLTEALGPLTYSEDEGEVFLGHSVTQHKHVSDETARKIDDEIRSIVDAAHQVAMKLVSENRDKLECMTEALMKYETIDSSQIDQIMDGEVPDAPADWDDSDDGGGKKVKRDASGDSSEKSDDSPSIGGPAEQH